MSTRPQKRQQAAPLPKRVKWQKTPNDGYIRIDCITRVWEDESDHKLYADVQGMSKRVIQLTESGEKTSLEQVAVYLNHMLGGES